MTTCPRSVEYQELEIELSEKRIREAQVAKESKTAEKSRNHLALGERKLDLEQKKSELDEIVAETKQGRRAAARRAGREIEGHIEERLLTAKRIRKNARNGLAVVYVQRDDTAGAANKIPAQRRAWISVRTQENIV